MLKKISNSVTVPLLRSPLMNTVQKLDHFHGPSKKGFGRILGMVLSSVQRAEPGISQAPSRQGGMNGPTVSRELQVLVCPVRVVQARVGLKGMSLFLLLAKGKSRAPVF